MPKHKKARKDMDEEYQEVSDTPEAQPEKERRPEGQSGHAPKAMADRYDPVADRERRAALHEEAQVPVEQPDPKPKEDPDA